MNTQTSLSRSLLIVAAATAGLLLIPFIAMYFTDQVLWTFSDFLFAGILLSGTGTMYVIISRLSDKAIYKYAVGLALFSGLFMIWSNLAVGIIGNESNPINLFYFGVIALGLIGAAITRARANGMVISMTVMATAVGAIGIYALLNPSLYDPGNSVTEIVGVNLLFIVLFSISAILFYHASKDEDQYEEI